MPKSGSSFLRDVISELPGFRRALLIPTSERREQELDEFCLQQVNNLDYVAQNHVRYSSWTAEMCREYDLRPVVLVRGLLDVIVSLRDHMRSEGPVWHNFFAEAHHVELDDAELELMIARLALPWYINFYMGWRQAPGTLMIRYEDLIAAPAKVVGDILAFSGAEVAAAEVERVVEHVRGVGESRFNVGVVGRGSTLRPETVRTVLELLDFYPEAAADPYVVAIRSQARAALSGAPSPAIPSAPSRASRTASRPWLNAKAKLLVMRRLIPLALVTLAGLYWIWPNDLMPDTSRIGYLDDAVVLLIFAFAAGRFSRHKAFRKRQPQRLRRDVGHIA